MDYRARWYDPGLGHFIQADTIVPGAGHPQALNRYAYTLGNPVRYVDPSGHIADDPHELARADEILHLLIDDYGVTIDKDWGWKWQWVNKHRWDAGSWELAELEVVLTGVSDLAGSMGGAQQFRANLGGVQIMRRDMETPGRATAHKVWLRSIESGGFLGQWMGKWTVVHELAHAWDAVNGWQLSRELEEFTGGRTTWKWNGGLLTRRYDWGGVPPKGANHNFNRLEDFAESVTTFVYPEEAQMFIQSNFTDNKRFHYDDYYQTQRALYIAEHLNLDLQSLDYGR